MSTLTKIVSLAKKLKKEAPNKFAKWTDYVKEASKKIKPVVKKAKKVAKKVTKKAKKTYKKHFGETHKDTNSHNVKLSIYSGTGLRKDENTLSYAKPNSKLKDSLYTESILHEINRLINERNLAENKQAFNDKISKSHIDKTQKIRFKKLAIEYKNLVKYYTKQISILKNKLK